MFSLDRLVANTHAIRAAASSSLPPSPFTNAVLNTHLGDLIREIEPAELGLFTPQLARVEFHGPAPRKKQDPEVYAQAAYTYIDRYNSIRPMPRAHAQVVGILDQLAATRENISALTNALEQIQPSELKPLIDQEEQRVHDLQAKLAELKQRKDAAMVQSKPRPRKVRQTAPAVSRQPSTPVQSSSKQEETVHTPAAAGRALRFTENLLMDELVDLADVSVTSPIAPLRILERADTVDDDDFGEKSRDEASEESVTEPTSIMEDTLDDDPTIVLPKSAAAVPLSPVSPTTSTTSAPTPSSPTQPNTETPKKGKVRLNSEVERIVVKIWTSAGDLIMPGHRYDTSATGNGNKPPRAKETMLVAHLQTIAALTPTPASPSTTISSTAAPGNTTPTPQQILTAHLLLSLLNTGPQFSLPLNKVKELLSAKASISGGTGIVLGGQSTNRVLYGCVAKRLVKIERGGGEQIVKFDTTPTLFHKMYPSIILVIFSVLVCALRVNAGVYFIQPASGSKCKAGAECTVQWDDDGILPLLNDVGIVTAGLYTGKQQLVQSLPPLDVASRQSIKFTPMAQAGPNSESYYLAFKSTTAKLNGTDYLAFSPFFSLEGMSGDFSSPLASATTTFSTPKFLSNTGTLIPTTIVVGNVDTSLPPSPSPSASSPSPSSQSSASETSKSSSSRFTTSSLPPSSSSSIAASFTGSGAPPTNTSPASPSRPLSVPVLAVLSLCAFASNFIS
ncbi:hypothetical protein R3P38DRAFT_3341669 [Favolaschia claudopus]|uniref:Uncharacterized protein n=1 Tax=Favolaschia claudopus TaxID=2862362 RepID=A0AAW0E0V4_9AGAR